MQIQKVFSSCDTRGLNEICPEVNYTKIEEVIRKKKSFEIYRTLLEQNKKAKTKEDRLSSEKIAEISGISRASYYRIKKEFDLKGSTLWKEMEKRTRRPKNVKKSEITEEKRQRVLEIRLANPTYGRDKIRVILLRDFAIDLSGSTVGRILKKFKERNRIPKYSLSQIPKKRHRNFNEKEGWAERWDYNKHCICNKDKTSLKKIAIGELIQIDHMVVTENNVSMEQFSATRILVSEVYSNANSHSAMKFLEEKVIKDFPFPIKSIQVDGGSEFMKYFEDSCRRQDIPLYVLPPSRPKYNGRVERSNRILREEFYSRKDLLANNLTEFREELAKYLGEKYNNYRPHSALDFMTPIGYYLSVGGGG
jgi:transposase